MARVATTYARGVVPSLVDAMTPKVSITIAGDM
jgi:hypothetical protein